MKKDIRSFRKFITRGQSNREIHELSHSRPKLLVDDTVKNNEAERSDFSKSFKPQRSAGVQWTIDIPDRVPINTTIIRVEKGNNKIPRFEEEEIQNGGEKISKRKYQRRISLAKYDSSNKVEPLRRKGIPVDSFYANPLSEHDTRKKGKSTSSHRNRHEPENNDDPRSIKVRLNSAYRAKINELGLSFMFALSAEEKMRMRRNRFRTNHEPVILVQSTLASDLKEEFRNYCGRKKLKKNWLYNIQ